jgi:hypothetical protein
VLHAGGEVPELTQRDPLERRDLAQVERQRLASAFASGAPRQSGATLDAQQPALGEVEVEVAQQVADGGEHGDEHRHGPELQSANDDQDDARAS